jgi:hypothetical protein
LCLRKNAFIDSAFEVAQPLHLSKKTFTASPFGATQALYLRKNAFTPSVITNYFSQTPFQSANRAAYTPRQPCSQRFKKLRNKRSTPTSFPSSSFERQPAISVKTRKRESEKCPLCALVTSRDAFNQRKNPFIKSADLARYDYQFLVLPSKLSLPNMRRQRVLAASLTQFVHRLAKRRSVMLEESFFALEIC